MGCIFSRPSTTESQPSNSGCRPRPKHESCFRFLGTSKTQLWLAARTSEIHGDSVATISNGGGVTKFCNNQVLQSDREMEISEATKGRGLRGKLNKVVLACSGGLDTSVMVPCIRENYGYDVAYVGQGIGELEGLEAKAKASGTSQFVVKDLKEQFTMVDIAKEVGADAVSHGCTEKGNDQELESLTIDRESMQLKDSIAGRWFDPLCKSMDAFMEKNH